MTMGLPELFRRPPADPVTAIEVRSNARDAAVWREGRTSDLVQALVHDVARETVEQAVDLAKYAELRAGDSPVARAAAAEILDEGVMQLRIGLHRAGENIRRTAGM